MKREEMLVAVKICIRQHVGHDNAISQYEVYRSVTGLPIVPGRKYDHTRIIRSIVEQLRREGCPIGNRSGAKGGYFWASHLPDLDPTIKSFHSRAMSSLKQEAALKQISEVELIKQYQLELSLPSETETPIQPEKEIA